MTSFFEKLKKGMGVTALPTEKEKEAPTVEPRRKATSIQGKRRSSQNKEKKTKVTSEETKKIEGKTEEKIAPREEVKPEPKKIEIKELALAKEAPAEKEKPTSAKIIEGKEKIWFEPEGQLAVDVYQTDEEIVIQAAIAGVKPDELDISVENDVVTIRGNREKIADLEKEEKNYFYQECYWGRFSREIILPAEVDASKTEAAMKEGVLTIRIPKIEREKKRKILIKR